MGAFVETVIAGVKQRIEFYQKVADGRFACRENAHAIDSPNDALSQLNKRTQDREVEGTHAK